MTEPIAALYDATEDHCAAVQMAGKPVPPVHVEYHRCGALYEYTVIVASLIVATAQSRSLERAARECRRKFLEWSNDQPEVIEAELAVSLQSAIRERHAGGAR